MSGVFQNIDAPPPHRPASVSSPRLWCGGRTHLLGGGSKVRKTPDTALYSIHVSTLCMQAYERMLDNKMRRLIVKDRTTNIMIFQGESCRVVFYCVCSSKREVQRRSFLCVSSIFFECILSLIIFSQQIGAARK
jgi:hypothetical protein